MNAPGSSPDESTNRTGTPAGRIQEEMDMAKAKFDIKLVQTEATKSLYAGAGVVDLAVETVKEYGTAVAKRVTDLQKDAQSKVAEVQKTVTGFDFEPKALRTQATTLVNTRVEALTEEAKTRRAAIEARVSELQGEAKALPGKVQKSFGENVATATSAYTDLAKRGEVLVGRIRNQESTKATVSAAKTTTAKAKTTKTQATTAAKKTSAAAKKSTATAKKSSAPAKRSAKATGTAAKKTATSAATATEAAAKKVGD